VTGTLALAQNSWSRIWIFFLSAQRALVTGATGFIGRHLVDGLIDANMQVVTLIRPGSRLPDQWRGRVTSLECADWSEAGLRAALASRPFDVVFHLATYGVRPTDRDPGLMLRINVDLPALFVHLCKERGARLVMAGTFSEYQKPADRRPLTEQSPLEMGKIYGASKAAAGILASALAESLGVRLRLLRFFQVYGEGEAPHRLLPSLVAGLSRGERVPLSDGTQVRDFIYVDDVVEACIKAGDDMVSRSRALTAAWNVCTGVGHSVRTFAELVAQAMGERAELLGFGELPMRADDELYLVGDGERMFRELGWRPKHDLGAGIRAAVAILMANQRAAV
jgi:nucleoside-diphosphate-sugar epimerase